MKNRNGFTLVELLVVVVIMGIVIGISIPLINNIKERNNNKKYDVYGKAMLSSAKIYKDSYEKDLFGYNLSGCREVSLEELIKHKLIKDFPDKNISCVDNNSLVRIVKMNKKYGYSYNLYCSENGNGVEMKSFSQSKRDSLDDSLCSKEVSMGIDIKKSGGNTLSDDIKVVLESLTGINSNLSIKYAWTDNKDSISSLDFQRVSFSSIPSKNKQESIIVNQNTPIKLLSQNLKKPSFKARDNYLVLEVSTYMDLYGFEWNILDEETKEGKEIIENKYIVFGPWASSNVNVSFDLNITGHSKGSLSFTEKQVFIGDEYGDLPTAIRTLYGFDAYSFDGWYTKPVDGSKITKSSEVKIDEDHILYAHWNDKPVEIGSYMNCKKKIDLSHGELVERQPIITWQQNNSLNQKWYITDNSDGTVTFKIASDNKWCMDVNWGNFSNYEVIQLWPCINSNAQKFKIREFNNNVISILAYDGNHCINVNGGSLLPNNQLHLWDTCSNNDEASLWYSKCPNDSTPPTCNPGAAWEVENGNVFQAGCNDNESGCSKNTANFKAAFNTNDVNQTVTIFDRAGNETKCRANYICANVVYRDGDNCSASCGGGTKNRIAYAASNQNHRCPNKDSATGGSACNTQSCCSESNPAGCPRKHACRLGDTKVFSGTDPSEDSETIVTNAEELPVIRTNGIWTKVYLGRNRLFSQGDWHDRGWIQTRCLWDLWKICNYDVCPG